MCNIYYTNDILKALPELIFCGFVSLLCILHNASNLAVASAIVRSGIYKRTAKPMLRTTYERTRAYYEENRRSLTVPIS